MFTQDLDSIFFSVPMKPDVYVFFSCPHPFMHQMSRSNKFELQLLLNWQYNWKAVIEHRFVLTHWHWLIWTLCHNPITKTLIIIILDALSGRRGLQLCLVAGFEGSECFAITLNLELLPLLNVFIYFSSNSDIPRYSSDIPQIFLDHSSSKYNFAFIWQSQPNEWHHFKRV